MNEEQLQVLVANGYDYTYGGIIDSEGKYISSVTIGEYTMNSELSEKDWLEYITSIKRTQKEEVENTLKSTLEVTKPAVKEIVKNKISVTTKPKDDSQLFNKSIYTYPIALGLSITIFLIIKRITK